MSRSVTCTPYLYFKGACAEALAFYAGLGLGTVRELRTYEGTPAVQRFGDGWRDKVLHSLFEGPGIRFYAGDGPDSEPMKGCALLLELSDVSAATALFQSLSAGGRVTVGFARQHWGDHYGNFTDRFGVQWAVNCSPRGEES
ncbi:MAG TPA: VOC family protein [Polyangiaceae bacterium]